MTTDLSIRVERHLEADAADIFAAWIEPDHARHWLFSTSDSEIFRCEMDARPGGRFLIADRRPDGDVFHVGEFDEIDPPHRLRFHYSAGDRASVGLHDAAEVIVTIVPENSGSRLTVMHKIARSEAEHEDRTRQSWETVLAALAAHLGVWVEKPDVSPHDGGLA